MRKEDEQAFYKLLLVTCKACQPNSKPMDADVMNLIFDDLERYQFELVKAALMAHRQDPDRGQWLPSVAHIEHQINIRRPIIWLSADEAWSRVPKIESQPGLMTDETAQALAVAAPFLALARPDMTAARMAFKGCYERLIERAKLERRGPEYFVSPGGSFEEQQAIIEDGVRMGLLPAPAPQQMLAASLQTQGPTPEFKALLLSLKQKELPPPEAQDYEP